MNGPIMSIICQMESALATGVSSSFQELRYARDAKIKRPLVGWLFTSGARDRLLEVALQHCHITDAKGCKG